MSLYNGFMSATQAINTINARRTALAVNELLAAYFGEADHSFRTKAITRFGPSRSVISVQGDHAFRSMLITA